MNASPEAFRLRSIVLVVVLGFAAWRVLSLGLADHFAPRDPAAALAWRGSHPQALLAASDHAQGRRAEEFAMRAIRASPLDGEGYRRLAERVLGAGDPERALALYRIAARLSPRDRTAQAWLVDHFLGQGDVVSALAYLDPLLRVEPDFVPGAMPVLVAMAETPAAQGPLVERLATSPPWRHVVLRGLPRHATDIDAMSRFFALLGQSVALDSADLDPWLSRLGAEGRWGDAYLAWVSHLPPARREGLGNVADGGFEMPPDQGGFGWRFTQIAGARITRIRESGSPSDHALRVAFHHQRVPFANVRQLLALPPGNWRLAGQVRVENLRSERGLVWRVRCAPPERATLAETSPFRGHSDWREFSVEFSVPAECGGQWLELRLPARIEAEQRIGGQISFDDLRITRIR